ncbi:MAG: hypothetical protein ACTHKP_09300 [Nitrososphaeraceae archaeon]|nr:hypothetical protein [Nitrososphaeraceae archaeon]
MFTTVLGLAILLVGIGIGIQQAQARVNSSYANSTLPIFEQKCKQELGIPQDHPLGMGFLQCMNTMKMLANHTLPAGK